MAKTPPGPGENPTGGAPKPLVEMAFTVDGEPSRKYIIATPDGQTSRSENVPFLMGRDAKIYVDKKRVPEGTKGFKVTITAVR